MEAARIPPDFAVVLTCSVTPRPFAGTRAASADERADDYRRCLARYLKYDPSIKRIVILENTDYPMGNIVNAVSEVAADDVEIEAVSAGSNDFEFGLGKGYGEFLMLKEGFERSRLLRDCSHFAKLTGRTMLRNLTAMALSTPPGAGLYCDLRDHNFGRFLPLLGSSKFADSRFFVVSSDFFREHLLNAYQSMNDSIGRYAEHVLYDVAMQNAHRPDVYIRFKREPVYSGVAGFVGADYDSPKLRLKRRIRAMSRQLFPSLKI